MKPNIGAGDRGTTALLFGRRVSKASPQPEAYGTVDELTSTLGLAKSLCRQEYARVIIDDLQKDLGIVAAELATEPERHEELGKHGWIPLSKESLLYAPGPGRARRRVDAAALPQSHSARIPAALITACQRAPSLRIRPRISSGVVT